MGYLIWYNGYGINDKNYGIQGILRDSNVF